MKDRLSNKSKKVCKIMVSSISNFPSSEKKKVSTSTYLEMIVLVHRHPFHFFHIYKIKQFAYISKTLIVNKSDVWFSIFH